MHMHRQLLHVHRDLQDSSRKYLIVGVNDGKLEVPIDIDVRHSKVEERSDVLRVAVVALFIRGAF